MNIFEKIIAHEVKSEIIYEDDRVIAFNDISPKSPGHFLVVPKVKSKNLLDIKNDDLQYLIIVAKDLAKEVIEDLGVKGFKLIINNGKAASQEILHTHIHIIPSLNK